MAGFKLKAIAFFLGSSVLIPSALSATLSGRVVTDDSKVIAGAIVTLWNDERDQKLSTYTDAQGYYALTTDFTGDVILRGRSPYYRDVNVSISLAEDTEINQPLLLSKLIDPVEISNSLPASAHAAQLDLKDEEARGAFIAQCNYCHQQGNALTRRARTEDEWGQAILRMEGYGSYISDDEHEKIKKVLSHGFNGEPIDVVQTSEFSPELADAIIHEWLVATPLSFLHDTVVGKNGKLYGIDEGSDTIWELDRETDEVIENKMPNPENLQEGGNFAGLQLPIGIFTGSQGPHSGAQIGDGRIFITNALSSNLASFDPKTRVFKYYPIPRGFLWRKGLYSHTIRADSDDNVWFTVLASNMVLKFDTKTEEFTEIKLPSNGFVRWMTDTLTGAMLKIASYYPKENLHLSLSHHKWLNEGREVFNWPYGIDINPLDGSIWYGKLLADKIGRIDPKTLEVTEYDTPAKGPRRMRFDKDGILWIPSFDDGKLMRFDPKAATFDTIDLPLLSKDEYEVPYALNVHEHTGDIWIAANNSDRVLRYLPNEKRFIAYAMPGKVVWFRDFEFTEDGQVCASNSNLPAYAHEDGLPAFVCIDANGNAEK